MELHCREVFCFVYIWADTKNEVTKSYERNCNKIIISIVQMKYLFYKLSRRIRLHYNSRAELSSYNLSNSSRKLIKQIFHLNNTYNNFIAIPFTRTGTLNWKRKQQSETARTVAPLGDGLLHTYCVPVSRGRLTVVTPKWHSRPRSRRRGHTRTHRNAQPLRFSGDVLQSQCKHRWQTDAVAETCTHKRLGNCIA